MTLLRHGGFNPPCVVGDARFGMELLDRRADGPSSAPRHALRLLVPDHRSDLGHFADRLSNRSEHPCGELPGTCIGNIKVCCEELT
jgi:hypothetical protein